MRLRFFPKTFLLPVLLVISQYLFAQDRVITGTVTDTKGSGVPGVSVTPKGSTIGTQTNSDGSYRITVGPSISVLVFSSIGFNSQEVSIGGSNTVDVTMEINNTSLGEVVVTGYGTARKKDLTGSITNITAKDFNKGPVTSPEQLVVGKIAGVQITTGGGMPGAGSRIRIRSGASLNASNDPLIVVDGIPLETGGISGTANPLALINPNDIESFNILKDASATAIYGSRASNGVIIITTKKGTAGKLKGTFSTVHSLSTLTDKVDVLNSTQYRDLVNAQGTASQKALLGNENTDWQDVIYRNAYSADNNISFSGGIKNFPYRLSIGYLNQSGVLLNDNMQRYSTAINFNPRYLKNHLSVDLNIKGTITKSHFANQGAIGAAVFFDPTQPVYDLSKPEYGGFWEWELNGAPNTLASRNPLSLLEQREAIGNSNRSIGNLQLDYKFHFLPDLRANLNVGYDVSRGYGYTRVPKTAASAYFDMGTYSRYLQKRTNNLIDFYFNYAKNFTGLKSRVDATAGYSYQDWIETVPASESYNGSGVVIDRNNAYKSQHTLVSFFGRLNYSYDERYLITGTYRRDGSSRFGPDTRWGWFPSVAVAWRVSREAFLRDSRVLSDLKFRFGWGNTGQQDVGSNYPYLARYSPSDSSAMYQFGNTFYPLLRPEGYDENLKWESTDTKNLGMDFGFLNGRISGSVDVYRKETKDLLAVISVPAGSNLTNRILTNVGNIENEGLEAVLNVTPVRTKDFTWDASANFTYNESKITNLSKVHDPNSIGNAVGGIAGGVGNTIQIHTVGFAPYTFYVYKQVYDQNGRPIEGVYVDLNKDGASNESDKYRYKNPEPRMFMGFSSQFNYKKWNAGFSARASVDNYMYNNFNSNNGTYQNFGYPNYLGNVSSDVLNTGFSIVRLWSDYYIENASFVRMDNAYLGYDFGSILKNSTLRVTATVQNVFIITKYSGLDPEIAGGIDNNFYPRPRIYSLGLNLGF